MLLPPTSHHRTNAGAAVTLALGTALIVSFPAAALALALALASAASFPNPSNTPLFNRIITAMTAPATRAASKIQKSQQMRVRRFFFDC